MEYRDVVIIGGGPAGRVVVHALHHAGWAEGGRSVTLIKEKPINVNRCAVPYGISEDKPIEKYLIPNALVTNFGAELLIDRVEEIDTARHVVRLRDGASIEYGRLVLATGSQPIMPPIPGIDASNITPVRSHDDLQRLRTFARDHKRAVVVGGGYIGVEVAVVLRQLGLEVTIVEMLDHVIQAAAEPIFIETIERDLTEHGVTLETGVGVAGFITEDNTMTGVRLGDGRMIDADFAVISIGVRPNTDLAKAAKLDVTAFGVVVDDHMRTSAEDVYAAGDCAEKRSFITGQPVRGEFGTNAVFMAKVLAANILGRDAAFPGVINASATTTFSYSVGSAGFTAHAAEEQGLDIVIGDSEVLDRYPMLDGVSPILTRLVFERSTGRLVGGGVLRRGHVVAGNIDFISLAIQMGATADDLLRLQYATHPELAAKPSDNIFTFAAKAAIQAMKRQEASMA